MKAAILVLVLAAGPLAAQQPADPEFRFANVNPAYAAGQGPRVCMDVAHNNFQSAERNPGAYNPFAELLRGDGYRVAETAQKFLPEMLKECDVLVIADATGDDNLRDWAFPHPSAFRRAELEALYQWLRGGGALLLIADHAPFGATTAMLASRFGVEMGKGYAWDVTNNSREPSTTIVYSRENGSLGAHPITRGITRVVAFTGQSLSVPPGAAVLLKFGNAAYESSGANAQADIAAFREGKPTAARSVAGRAQGLAFDYGKGRVVMMGEAAMFSAQVARFRDPQGRLHEIKMGMNVAGNDNRQFLVNVMHWLTRLER